MDEEKKIEETPVAEKSVEDQISRDKKKIKNLISISILLAGLFVGSLFVDVAQLIKGGGFSQKALQSSDIFADGGKTWVAYNDPIVNVQVLTDPSKDPSEVLVWLKQVFPTISAQKVDYTSDAGKKLIKEYGITSVPAFIFSKDVTQTTVYSQAQQVFAPKDGSYVLDTQQLGIPVDKTLATPQVEKNDATFGNKDAKVKIFVFSDFQCPYCKQFWSSLRGAMKQYGDKIFVDYKEFPLPIHPQSQNAANAAMCALDQNKFWEYGDKLYATQDDWGNSQGTAKFKTYAQQIGLNVTQFDQCLDNKTHQDAINADTKEAQNLSIAGTPGIFINDQFTNGAMTSAQLNQAIDQALGK